MPNSQLMESDSPEVQNMAALNNAFPTIEERSKNMHHLAEAYWFTAHQAHARHMSDLVFGDSQVLLTSALLLSNFALFSLDNRESDLLLRWLYLGSDIQVLHQFYHRSIREGRCVTFAKAIKQLDEKREPYEKLNPFINLLKFDADNEDVTEQDMAAYKIAIDFVAQTLRDDDLCRAEPIEIAERMMLFPALIPSRLRI
ncbi:hypothetical protein MRB53_037765 [Persea americana]|nr:hypothetical protein MRB53_037765 [Persea americana]